MHRVCLSSSVLSLARSWTNSSECSAVHAHTFARAIRRVHSHQVHTLHHNTNNNNIITRMIKHFSFSVIIMSKYVSLQLPFFSSSSLSTCAIALSALTPMNALTNIVEYPRSFIRRRREHESLFRTPRWMQQRYQ